MPVYVGEIIGGGIGLLIVLLVWLVVGWWNGW